MDYVEQPNSNLICCICHAPFTNPTTARTCLHTFCHDCISVAVQHSPQCPIDRSSLSLDDLLPANPIVKHLVDELIIECPNRVSGCTQTFQRQLLSAHVKDTCQYVEIPCSEEQCDKLILRKDTHNSECPSKSATCSFCFEEFPRSQSQAHAAICLDYEIPCTQANNGCSWTGPRRQFSDEHVLSCPYEAIKGFFSINNAQLSSLNTENALSDKKDIQTFRNVLGPWYRLHTQDQTPTNRFPIHQTPSITSSRHRPITEKLTSHNEIDALAPYFPLPHEHAFQESHTYPRSHPHLSQRTLPLTPVAPLNLSTSLEGSLSGLRESIAAVSASNSALLKYAVHGIRLQLHRLMMDRNAQVTGRGGEPPLKPTRQSDYFSTLRYQ
ncbi:hypothetical protein F4604DRAFT_2001900 [Suillus subluteus]|nr:hypothetical protein F4604DRAFT_2001900 [Suillus subluteus]